MTTRQKRMFDGIALKYDFLNRILSLGLDESWRKKTILAIEQKAGSRILDLATGTGDLGLAALRTISNSTVWGIDLSLNMMRLGARKAAQAGFDKQFKFVLGDAQNLCFRDGAFDAATMAFGIRNVEDRTKALREIARVVKKGGRIGILELLEPKRGILGVLAKFYVRRLVPRIGALLSSAAEYRYLQESIAAFPSPDDFADIMENSGIEVLKLESFGFGACCLFIGTPKKRA